MPNSRSSHQDLRILVVEDEYLIAAEIEFELKDLGHEVVGPVPTIEAAMALLANETIDCAFLDANLRGISSAPIAVELASRKIPYFVVTGYGDLTLQAPELDAAPRVSKPFSGSDFAAVLAKTFVR